jgi:hypothetical protein
MANEMVTELPPVGSTLLTDIIYAVQNGISVQETMQQVANLMLSNTILSSSVNPNGAVAGVTYQLCWDYTDGALYICTTSGTATSAVWMPAGGSIGIPISMADGGTGASLFPSDGGIVYTDASNMEILAGTSTANQALLSGANTAPSWSIATYPSTVAANEILFASATNAIIGLATLADAILLTDGLGIPAWSLLSSFPYLPLSGGTLTGPLYLSGSPTSPTQAADKAYVDLIASGIIVQPSVYAATTGSDLGYTYNNGSSGVGATLTAPSDGAFSIDSVSPPLNSRILVKDETNAAYNGIYDLTTVGNVSTAAVLTRDTDYDTTAQIQPGDLVAVNNGNINAGTAWLQTATVTTIGTSPINFSPFSIITVGTGLTKTGNQVSLIVPVTVPLGGTDLTSTTPYAILCGGTTSSSALQQVANLGTAGQVLTSNGSGTLPTFQESTAVFEPPQVTVYGAGSGSYSTPAGTLYLKVQGVAAGGSGAGASSNNGNVGGNTTFSSFTADGGAGGLVGTSGTPPPAGASGGYLNVDGGQGSQASYNGAGIGGNGGISFFGGGGVSQFGNAGGAAVGPGCGGAGGAGDASHYGGSGGNAGAYFEGIITSPSGSYAYSVGSGGTPVSGGGTGYSSGSGADGLIIVTAYFQ